MQKHFDKLEPNSIREMCETMSRREVAAIIGLSASGIGTILQRNKCTAVCERAAQYWLEGQESMEAKATTYIITVPADQRDAVCAFLRAVKINKTVLEA